MAYMNNLDFKDISNARISSRIKQVVVLVVVIIIGMIISVTVNAQEDFHKNKSRHFRTKYRTQINQYANACDLLDKKKMQSRKATHTTSPQFASLHDKNRKLKFR